MAKMLKLTDGGKVKVDSFGRAQEGKCCCPSTVDCTACDATNVAATTAIVTISGFAGPVPGASTFCGSQCSTFNGTFYLPFSFSSHVGTNYTCSWRLPTTTCSLGYMEFAITYDSSGNKTNIVVSGNVATQLNFVWIQNGIQGRVDCHQSFAPPYSGTAPSTNFYCDGSGSSASVVLS